MKSSQLAKKIATAADDKKAREIVVIDLAGKTDIADYFVICEGDTDRHVRAICDNIETNCKKFGVRATHVSGYEDASWACMDFDDVVVHVLLPGERSYYDLEGLWAATADARVSGQAKVEKRQTR
jgi:ribosome-associated protein